MARMLNQEETDKMYALEMIDCVNCPCRGTCKKDPDQDLSTAAVLERMRFGCDLDKNYPWGVVYGYKRDSKFGRYAVNWENGWRRHPNFEEFYGGAVVD